jgi:hypothetical protein
MEQKWCNAFNESIRVPLIVKVPPSAERRFPVEIAALHLPDRARRLRGTVACGEVR